MTTLRRALVVAEMQSRELSRRRVAMGLFALLPAAFYFSIPADQDYGVLAGAIGVSWAVAAGGLFGILGWRRIDARLALIGARPAEGMLGRVLVGATLGVALVAVYSPLMLARSTIITDATAFVGALIAIAAVSVPLGLLIGALLPRELEGTLVLIGVVGVESSVPPDSALASALPLYGPFELLQASIGVPDATVTTGLVHTVLTAAVLGGAAHLLWRRRLQVARAGVR